MATITPTGEKVPGPVGKASVVTWSAMATGDTGSAVQSPGFSDRSVQVEGTFGGATVTIQGSNDGTNYYTLTDTAGVALTFTSAGLRQMLQITRYVRPAVTAGAGSALKVSLLIVGDK